MKKIITDHFDKLLMTIVFIVLLACYLIYFTDVLAGLVRDSFLVLTALLGFRRPAPSPNINSTETGDIVAPETTLTEK